jgi:mono/diheme cytochrome c family protein
MPNISPDRDTGIGAWSDTQIIAAVRRGLRPDGTRLAPLMPYAYYNRMTDGDAAALVAYLRAQAPVRHEVARSENLPMKPIDVAEPRGSVDRVHDLHAHGEYIATLMHCAACHTPMEGSLANQAYAGGTRFGDVVAPNITPDRDTGIGSWSEDDIIRAVREMKDPSGHKLHPPMADYREDWAHLTGTDAHALVIFLRKVPPVHHELEETQHPVSQQP